MNELPELANPLLKKNIANTIVLFTFKQREHQPWGKIPFLIGDFSCYKSEYISIL
jgi:hypothetical protein